MIPYISLLLTACQAGRFQPTPIVTLHPTQEPTATAAPVVTPTEIAPPPTETVDPILNEPIAHQETAKATVEGVPLEFDVITYKSILDRPENKNPLPFPIGYSPYYDHETGTWDFSTPDVTAKNAKETMIKGWALTVYNAWKVNATEEQKTTVSEVFGKSRDKVTFEEYWQAVNAWKSGDPTVSFDDVSWRVYGYNADQEREGWTDVDPTMPVSWGMTANEKYMSIYMNGTDHYASQGMATIIKDGIVEMRFKYPENLLVNSVTQINAWLIKSLNRLTFPVSDQQIGELGFEHNHSSELETYTPSLWKTLIIHPTNLGVDAGPLTLK